MRTTGKTGMYTGIGFDVVSREYEEMRVPNLRAVGRAIREVNAEG